MADTDTIDGKVALSIPEAAKALDASESTVRRMMESGKLVWTRVGSDRRVTAQSILALMREPTP